MKKDVSSLKKLRVCVWLALTLLTATTFSTQYASGSTYDFMMLQSNLSAVVPSVVLQNGTDNVSFIYANDTSAKVTVEATTSFATYNYTLDIVNNNTTERNVKSEVYFSFNISRISNATIILHNNATSSTQIVIADGSIVQSSGSYYDLSGSSTVHIKVENLKESVEGISYFHTYFRIRIPNTTIYTIYTITFEFT